MALEKYREKLEDLRSVHYTTIEAQYDALVDKKWLIAPDDAHLSHMADPDDDVAWFFSEQNVMRSARRRYAQYLLLLVLVGTFWYSFYNIYWQSSLFEGVALGLDAFEAMEVRWYDWGVAGVYLCAWSLYNAREIRRSIANSGRRCCFIVRCCRISKDIESRFATPFFDASAFDADGNGGKSPDSVAELHAGGGIRNLYAPDRVQSNEDV